MEPRFLYTLACMRPEWRVEIKPPPLPTPMEILMGVLTEIIIPSALFALSFTAFAWALRII